MPITDGVYRILFEGGQAKDVLMELMSRSAKDE
jgi:glycerol-3-phosphate dehydrogenase